MSAATASNAARAVVKGSKLWPHKAPTLTVSALMRNIYQGFESF